MSILVSRIPDNNIGHIFFFDIIKYYSENYTSVFIDDTNIDKNNKCQIWRLYVMEKLYKQHIEYTQDKSIVNEQTLPSYNAWKFIEYKPEFNLINLVNKLASPKKGKYILLNIRKHNRILYDYKTKLKLEMFFNYKEFKIPFIWCCFDDMTVDEQSKICSEAAIFIGVHGAGCTNLIFLPKESPLVEINFRTHWYCDPVCDDHFYNKISINDKCNGRLHYVDTFHKADFHNICHLIDKKYKEIEAVEYQGRFLSRDPNSKTDIYIDGDALYQYIESLF